MFILMVGCPASGKTTWAKKFAEHKAEREEEVYIVSSDAIREELFGDERIQRDPTKVFELAHKRIINALEAGYEYVIFDATNITRKNRTALMNKIAHIHDEKRCVVFAEPYQTLCERNKSRSREVPQEVIWRMITQFEVPLYSEGYDDIYIVNHNTLDMDEHLQAMCGYNQHNPHHRLDLFDHCFRAGTFIINRFNDSPDYLLQAALLHDVGKPYVRTFKNAKGETTDVAHYYNHENVGGYFALMFKTDWTNENRLKIAQLISYHMVPYRLDSEKAKERWKNRLGELYEDVMKLHEADKFAH